MLRTDPPGYPKTTSTPMSPRALTKISAPVIFTASPFIEKPPFDSTGHGALARRADEPRVPREIAGPDLGRRGPPRFPPAQQLRPGHIEGELPPRNVEDDPVPVPDDGYGSPFHRLRRDVPDAGPVGA